MTDINCEFINDLSHEHLFLKMLIEIFHMLDELINSNQIDMILNDKILKQ